LYTGIIREFTGLYFAVVRSLENSPKMKERLEMPERTS
jgi:hypothetical protein